MQHISLTQLSKPVILRDFAALLAKDRSTTVQLLAYLGEMDRRRMFLDAGYSSMAEYCVGEFHMSEGIAYRRIRAAHAARKFPVILDAIEDGRLHLAAVALLGRHLSRENVDELLAAATHKSRRQVEKLVAERFPEPDVPTYVRVIAAAAPNPSHCTRGDAADTPELLAATAANEAEPLALTNMGPVSPGTLAPPLATNGATHVEPLLSRARISARSAENYAVQFNMSQAMHDQLRYAQALLGHSVPSSDVVRVFAVALDRLVHSLERRKFAKAFLKRPSPGSTNPRYIPAKVRRAVWQRDGGQCAFVGEQGHRCESRDRLEFDHVVPVARGGDSTVANIRLCCRAHNQYEAARVLGSEFMSRKREVAQARSKYAAKRGSSQDLVPRLCELGLSAEQAAEAAARCGSIPSVPFEERLTLALRGFAQAAVR